MTTPHISGCILIATGIALVTNSLADTHYVSTNSTTPGPPWTNWATAAHTIQEAVDGASSGDCVAVDDGVYALSSTIALTNGATLMSLNGPTNCILTGQNLFRCILVSGTGSEVRGMSITQGKADYGAGVVCSNGGAVVNCSIYSNTATVDVGPWRPPLRGGGAYIQNGVVRRCHVHDNLTQSWNYYEGWSYGAGIYCQDDGLIEGCLIDHNTALSWSYYAHGGTLSVPAYGGGIYIAGSGTVENCTIVENNSQWIGGGIYADSSASVRSSVVWANSNSNWIGDGSTFVASCSDPTPPGTNNINADPCFADPLSRDYHLTASSPCIDSGTNQDWMAEAKDLDSQIRVFNGCVDMGADEAVLEASSIIGSGIVTIEWKAVVGATCALQRASTLTGNIWSNVLNIVTATHATIYCTVTNNGDATSFQRLNWIR